MSYSEDKISTVLGVGNLAVRLIALSVGTLFATGYAKADIDEEMSESMMNTDEIITIASGSRLPVRRAPAIASVVTAEQIRESGATDLDDALQSVPGLHVSHSFMLYEPIYTFRGIHSPFNPEVLMLQNGVPMNGLFMGDRGNVWGGLPLENVSRIEVIRGPGSSLYGADAYAGVIDIVTKTAAEIDGTHVGARYGSYETGDAWILHGSKIGNVDVAAYLRVGTTNGNNQTIDVDAQTSLDQLYQTHSSFAPGALALARNSVDGSLDLSFGQWQIRTYLKQRERMQMGPGAAQALDPTAVNFSRRWTADVTHRASPMANLSTTVQFSYFNYNEENFSRLFPQGSFGGEFPDGVIENVKTWERHSRVSASAAYTGWKEHKVTVGMGYENSGMYGIQEEKNSLLVTVPGVGVMPTYIGGVFPANDLNSWFSPHDRSLLYGYVQDEWGFAHDWYLTAGARFDHYSDFGDTFNPRLALVWDTTLNVTTKFLYGRSFRAPAFGELYNTNNPIALGNPNLVPALNDTYEFGASWKPQDNLQLQGNVFYYKLRNMIAFQPNVDPTTGSTAQNEGGQTGKGLELEMNYRPSRVVKITGNYSLQNSTSTETNSPAADAPNQRIFSAVRWDFSDSLAAQLQADYVFGRKRTPDDARPSIPNYTKLDMTLITRPSVKGWSARFSIRNMLNSNVLEPSPSPGLIEKDLPMPGRNLYFELEKAL